MTIPLELRGAARLNPKFSDDHTSGTPRSGTPLPAPLTAGEFTLTSRTPDECPVIGVAFARPDLRPSSVSPDSLDPIQPFNAERNDAAVEGGGSKMR
jgi:hypothetical protein